MTDLNEIAENFLLFEEWEERYRYLIDLGRKIPPIDEALKVDQNLVRGCTSRVWMVAAFREGKFYFTADSDAHIVRGLIALLYAAYEGKSAEDIRATDIAGMFSRVGLDQHLSPNRRSGFFAMVERIAALSAREP